MRRSPKADDFVEKPMRRGLKEGDFKENRVEPRTRTLRSIDVLPCRAVKDWKFIPCLMVDCSLHGIALVAPEPMEAGEQFLVKLVLPQGVRLLVYTVQNSTNAEKNKHRIGARFSGLAAQGLDVDLATVLAEFAKKE